MFAKRYEIDDLPKPNLICYSIFLILNGFVRVYSPADRRRAHQVQQSVVAEAVTVEDGQSALIVLFVDEAVAPGDVSHLHLLLGVPAAQVYLFHREKIQETAIQRSNLSERRSVKKCATHAVKMMSKSVTFLWMALVPTINYDSGKNSFMKERQLWT